jgi:hypothetical protein
MNNDPIKSALQLIDEGHIEQEGPILIDLLAYKRPEDAWAWLYSCVKTDAQRIYCIRRILHINPSHQKAQNALVELKLREAMASSQVELQNTEESKTKRQIEQELAIIRVEHKEITENNESVMLPTQEQELNNEYEQAALPGLKDKVDIASSKLITSTSKEIKSKRKKKYKLASKQITLDEALPLPVKSSEPHVFNPKIYRIIFTKADENMFKENKSYSGFPETDSGMYGRRLLIGGIPITSFDYPYCVDIGRIPNESKCSVCEFFSIVDCPIRRDPIILNEAKTLFAQNRRYSEEYEAKRQQIIETIFTELKEHGRPLHYEVITKILHDRYPGLKLNSWKVLRLMSWHPEKFEWVDVGVYKAK